MRPEITLDGAAVRDNARAWRTFAGVPVRAVVKSDGYGWGAATLARELDGSVDGYFVADVDEFRALRPATRLPIAILGDVAASDIASVLDAGGIPNVSDAAALDAVAAWMQHGSRARARIRVGVNEAVGWPSVDADELPAFGARLARAGCDAEVWTHLTNLADAPGQRAAFQKALESLRASGARIVATDIDSSEPLARAQSPGAVVRLGAALFGFRFGARPGGVSCALRVRAPVIRTLPARGQLVGYGATRAPKSGYVTVVRCGYGDGFPRISDASVKILSVGMQYSVVCRRLAGNEAALDLLSAQTDLDLFAEAAGIAAHELIVRLGLGRGDQRMS